jgi:hypothetical protein
MTPKTMKSGRNPVNRAHWERVFPASLPMASSMPWEFQDGVLLTAKGVKSEIFLSSQPHN